MVSLQELTEYLDSLFNLPGVKDYCPNGLQVEGRAEIKSVATAVTASLETILEAEKAGVEALIVHHGLFWKGDSPVIVGPKKARLVPLFRSGISLFAYHLPMDAHPEIGNNWNAAKLLGWNDLEYFGDFDGTLIGVRGSFPPIERKAFCQKLESFYGHTATKALGGSEKVSSAALISGGAYRSISEAADAGVDCYITGNYDEPAWHLAHEHGINFYALGHAATERVGPKALAKKLGEIVPTRFLDLENPF